MKCLATKRIDSSEKELDHHHLKDLISSLLSLYVCTNKTMTGLTNMDALSLFLSTMLMFCSLYYEKLDASFFTMVSGCVCVLVIGTF